MRESVRIENHVLHMILFKAVKEREKLQFTLIFNYLATNSTYSCLEPGLKTFCSNSK